MNLHSEFNMSIHSETDFASGMATPRVKRPIGMVGANITTEDTAPNRND